VRSRGPIIADCPRRRGDRMKRRDFVTLLGSTAAWPLVARAQPAKIPRIGILSPGRSEEASPNRVTLQAFVAGMGGLGYVDGQNVIIERQLSEANTDRPVLWHPHAYSDRTMDGMIKEAEHAAQTLAMQLQFVPANSPEEITGTFSTITRD